MLVTDIQNSIVYYYTILIILNVCVFTIYYCFETKYEYIFYTKFNQWIGN